jgi:thiol-disulfide isomerase/thioredoxin
MKELESWEESEELLKGGTKDKPSLVIHYWNECPHCIKKMPMWEEFSNQLGGEYNVGKLEASKNDGNISAFPTYQGSINGSIKELKNITEEENYKKFQQEVGRKRRRFRTTKFINRRRKATHRTLRRYKTFR